MIDYDMSIHTNPDAQVWAKFFIETTKNMDRDSFRDEGYMIGWFANAMMAMHDHLTGQHVTVLDDGSAFFTATVGVK
jgi:predicted RNA-binding protein with EMAP domain